MLVTALSQVIERKKHFFRVLPEWKVLEGNGPHEGLDAGVMDMPKRFGDVQPL